LRIIDRFCAGWVRSGLERGHVGLVVFRACTSRAKCPTGASSDPVHGKTAEAARSSNWWEVSVPVSVYPRVTTEEVLGQVTEAIRMLGWAGVVLPETRFSECMLYPVIEWLPEIHHERLAAEEGPQLDRFTLSMWEAWSEVGTPAPRCPVAIVGVVSTRGPRAALASVTRMSGYGSGAVLLDSMRPVDPSFVAEAAEWNVDVAQMGDPPQILRWGRMGPVASARRTTATRHREEVLYEWALSHPELVGLN
jgi:hypothetical protein